MMDNPGSYPLPLPAQTVSWKQGTPLQGRQVERGWKVTLPGVVDMGKVLSPLVGALADVL